MIEEKKNQRQTSVLTNTDVTEQSSETNSGTTKITRNSLHKPEEDELAIELVDSAINSLSNGRAFTRRRLRRQETLREKQAEALKMGE